MCPESFPVKFQRWGPATPIFHHPDSAWISKTQSKSKHSPNFKKTESPSPNEVQKSDKIRLFDKRNAAIFSTLTQSKHCRYIISLKGQLYRDHGPKLIHPPDPSVERIGDFCNSNPVQYFHCVIQSDANLVSSEISDHCEISDLLFFVSYFASQSKGIYFAIAFLMCVV